MASLSTGEFAGAEFSVYPNPVNNGVLNIKSQKGGTLDIQLFDITGRQVIVRTLSTNQPIDVSTFKQGIYLLKISQQGVSTTRKIVIK